MTNFSYAYASNHSDCNYYSDKYFQINNCGALKVINEKGGLSDRPPRKDYLMLYLFDGDGWAEISGVRQDMTAGDLLYLKPGAPLHFKFNYKSMHFWIHFTGNAVDDMFNECGITDTNIYRIGVSNNLWDILTDIYLHHSNGGSGLLHANGYFMRFLGNIADVLKLDYSTKSIEREQKIYPALKEMNINYDKNHKIEYYAALCGISVSNFKHSFTKITGVTPQKYLISIRVEIAKKMLLTSKSSVQETAFAVGYEDPFYFSRLFKKVTGLSPREYQKNHVDTIQN